MNSVLQQFVQTGSQEAFARIVQTHIDAVFSQCLRQLQNRTLAEEATQLVFISLARKASRIPDGVVLGGWLFNAARYCCSNLRRMEARRSQREQKAAHMRTEIQFQPTPDKIAAIQNAEPLLDDAIASLSQRDRDAILLRYFEGQSIADLAQRLGISTDAAKQRVCRAVERLREYFTQRDIAMPSAALLGWLDVLNKPASAHLAGVATSAATGAAKTASATSSLLGWWSIGALKAAACGAVVTALAAGVIAASRPAAGDRVSTTAAPASRPAEPLSPAESFQRLSSAIKIGDAREINAYLHDDGSDRELAAAVAAVMEENGAMCRIRAASMDILHQPLSISDVQLALLPTGPGGMETIIDACLAAPNGRQFQVAGDTATYKVPLPREVFSGVGRNRIAELGRWSGATIYFNRVDGVWKLNTARTFTLALGVSLPPNGSRLQMAEALSAGLAMTLNETADGILAGTITTPQQARDHVHAGVAQLLERTQSKSIAAIMILPAVGG